MESIWMNIGEQVRTRPCGRSGRVRNSRSQGNCNRASLPGTAGRMMRCGKTVYWKAGTCTRSEA